MCADCSVSKITHCGDMLEPYTLMVCISLKPVFRKYENVQKG